MIHSNQYLVLVPNYVCKFPSPWQSKSLLIVVLFVTKMSEMLNCELVVVGEKVLVGTPSMTICPQKFAREKQIFWSLKKESSSVPCVKNPIWMKIA
jgi:hypothetical protein